jgi:hypothetical protein
MDDVDFEARVRGMVKEQEACLFAKRAARLAGDEAGQEKALDRLVSLEFEGLAVLKAKAGQLRVLARVKSRSSNDEKVAQLLLAFGLAAKLSRIWKDVHNENKKAAKFQRVAYEVAGRLDAIDDGRRSALAVFLDGSDTDAKALAASSLLKTMPERCVPILEELKTTERWLNASHIAIAALVMHEMGEESPTRIN